jgi:hypothetical protein
MRSALFRGRHNGAGVSADHNEVDPPRQAVFHKPARGARAHWSLNACVPLTKGSVIGQAIAEEVAEQAVACNLAHVHAVNRLGKRRWHTDGGRLQVHRLDAMQEMDGRSA